jgi:hypothetical protein
MTVAPRECQVRRGIIRLLWTDGETVMLGSAVGFPQHPYEYRPERPVLLAVDQELGECPRLRIPPELADPVGSLEVGEHQDP